MDRPLPKRAIDFLLKLYERTAGQTPYSMKDAVTSALKGTESASRYVHVKEEFAPFAMYILSTVGGRTDEERLEWMARACAHAASAATNSDTELSIQQADALRLLLTPDAEEVGEESTVFDQQVCQFFGEDNFVTFYGCEKYPAHFKKAGVRYELQNASYKKGTYRKMDSAERMPVEIQAATALLERQAQANTALLAAGQNFMD